MQLPSPHGRPSRVLWVTHLPAPYRIPVWRHLASRCRAVFAFTEGDERIGQLGSENRTADWAAGAYPDLTTVHLRTARLRWRNHPLYFLLPFSRLPRVRSCDAVLIGGWEAPAYWQILFLAKLLRKRTVGFYESTLETHRYRRGLFARARRWFFNQLDAVVVPGVSAGRAVAALGVQAERIHEGFNAVDVMAFHSGAARSSAGQREGHHFIYVGQLIARKRVDAAIEAFSRIAEDEDQLTIVGGGEQEEELRRLAAHVKKGRVLFRSTVLNADLPPVLGTADTLLLVSDEEVWGLVANEALAAGLHVVVSENCGVTASIEHMKGTFVARSDLSDLSTAMVASRSAWAGPIDEPEILKHTPEAFAEVFLRALLPERD